MVREDDLRATFDALHAKGAPPRPFEAIDVIRLGQKHRRAHRVWAVVGTGVATAAAVVAALMLIPVQAPEPVLPANPPQLSTTPVPSTVEPTSSTTPEPPTSSPPPDTSVSQPPSSFPATSR